MSVGETSENDGQHPFEVFVGQNRVRQAGRHDQAFAGAQDVFAAVDREAAGTLENGDQRVAVRFVRADFLTLGKGKKRDADRAVLDEGLADDLTWLNLDLILQLEDFIVIDVFKMCHCASLLAGLML